MNRGRATKAAFSIYDLRFTIYEHYLPPVMSPPVKPRPPLGGRGAVVSETYCMRSCERIISRNCCSSALRLPRVFSCSVPSMSRHCFASCRLTPPPPGWFTMPSASAAKEARNSTSMRKSSAPPAACSDGGASLSRSALLDADASPDSTRADSTVAACAASAVELSPARSGGVAGVSVRGGASSRLCLRGGPAGGDRGGGVGFVIWLFFV